MSAPVRLPAVPWLYVHDLVAVPVVDDEAPADAEGRTRTVTGDPVDVRGLLVFADVTDVQYGASAGVRVDAVARVAHDAPVGPGHQITAAGVSPFLDGDWTVELVRPTQVDLRLLLTRTTAGDA